MEEIIERILKIEEEAKGIVKESDEKMEHLEETLNSEISKLQKSLDSRARKKAESIKELEDKEAESKIAEIGQRKKEGIARLNKIYAEKKDEWVGKIVDSIVG